MSGVRQARIDLPDRDHIPKLPEVLDTESGLYLIMWEFGGVIKIGRSATLGKRITTHLRTGFSYGNIYRYICAVKLPEEGLPRIERVVLDKFKPVFTNHMPEWFMAGNGIPDANRVGQLFRRSILAEVGAEIEYFELSDRLPC
jgi:hypothetical protein